MTLGFPASRLHVEIEVPGDPVPWHRPAQDKQGRRFTDPRDEAHRELVALFARKAVRALAPLAGPCRVDAVFCFAPPKSAKRADVESMLCTGAIRPTGPPDLDNLVKLVLDAVKGIALDDDRTVVELFARKLYAAEPRTVLRIHALESKR